jgi:anti-sigma factor RsiW
MRQTEPDIVADAPAPRHRRRVKRRVSQPSRFSRTRQRFAAALVVAVAAAVAVAWFADASLQTSADEAPAASVR